MQLVFSQNDFLFTFTSNSGTVLNTMTFGDSRFFFLNHGVEISEEKL